MNLFTRAGLTAATFILLSTVVALGDDWTAAKLRGRVLQLVDQQWQPLQRGDIVPDGHVVRTLGGAQVQLTRGGETVDVGSDTQIQIFDKPTSGKPFTTVKQYFGTIAVEAEVEKVQHFAVQTPSLAAVVKGTKFTVKSGTNGASVSVQRGHVAVEDKHDKSHVTLSVGQQAVVDTAHSGSQIAVSGSGTLPVVLGANGQPEARLAVQDTKTAAEAEKKTEQADKKAEKAAEKAAKDAAKSSGSDNSSNSHDGSGSSSGSDNGNSGKGNSGDGNSGGGNSGHDNSGHGNSDSGGKGKGKKDG